MAGDDFLTDLWRIMVQRVGYAEADRELLELRRRWGGTRLYLHKPADIPRIEADRDSVKGKR